MRGCRCKLLRVLLLLLLTRNDMRSSLRTVSYVTGGSRTLGQAYKRYVGTCVSRKRFLKYAPTIPKMQHRAATPTTNCMAQ